MLAKNKRILISHPEICQEHDIHIHRKRERRAG